jgi:hypothetical protein
MAILKNDSQIAGITLSASGNYAGVVMQHKTDSEMNAISTPATGATIFNTGDNQYYTYSGNAWASAKGSSGAQGATGTGGGDGDRGPKGSKGGAGVQGATGAKGDANNTTGAQGPKGPKGGKGPAGYSGYHGAVGGGGPTGDQGPRSGAKGPKGDTGYTGYHGNTNTGGGAQGPKGSKGPQGPGGYSGYMGAGGGAGGGGAYGSRSGPKGIHGYTGYMGETNNATGAQGPRSSTQGAHGYSGYMGISNNATGARGPRSGGKGPVGAQGPGGGASTNQTMNTGNNVQLLQLGIGTGSIPGRCRIARMVTDAVIFCNGTPEGFRTLGGGNTGQVWRAHNYGGTDKHFVSRNGQWYHSGNRTSDKRLKKDIEEYSGSVLSNIDQFQPKQFFWKPDEENTNRKLGFIAQDYTASKFSELITGKEDEMNVVEAASGNKYSGSFGFNYDGATSLLVKAVSESMQLISNLKTKLTALENA